MKAPTLLLSLMGFLAGVTAAGAAEQDVREEALAALRRGAEFFRTQVAVQGAYLWQYSADLARREGEGKASRTRGWVQPPGTPAVGESFLSAHAVTGEAGFLAAARETGAALLRGQLRSGGWYYHIDFAPGDRRGLAYRVGGGERARNVTTLDDDTTQSALRFLMRLDRALGFQDESIRESVRFAWERLLRAQYPNGAWPQGYDELPDPAQFAVRPASYPETWSRTWPGSREYWLRYTLNDNVLADMIDTLLLAERIYGNARAGTEFNVLAKRCHAAAEKAGDFLLLAQLPEPQPAWAQQYDFDMHPCWARKFEPPAVTAGESQGVLRTLLRLYRASGNRKYLEPIPRALAYLQRSRLPDGRLARFYEVRSNRPLYFTRDYQLTTDDADVPTHYSFKVPDSTDAIAREYEQVRHLAPAMLSQAERTPARRGKPGIDQVRQVIAAQDEKGRWIEEGRLRYHGPNDPTTNVIRCTTFIQNMDILTRWLADR